MIIDRNALMLYLMITNHVSASSPLVLVVLTGA